MWTGLAALFIGQFSGSVIVPVVTKLGLKEFPALPFVFFRFVLSFILFIPIFLFQKNKKISLQQLIHIFILSFFLFLNVGLFTVGVQFTTVVMTQILYSATPIVVGIIGHFFLKEKITKQKVIGLFIALTGVGFLFYQSFEKQAHLTFGSPLGNILILIAMLGYSGYVIYSRILIKTSKYSSYQITFFTFLFTSILFSLMLPFSHVFSSTQMHITLLSMMSIVGVAIGTNILYFFIQVGIQRTNAFTASLFQYLAPFLAGIVSVPVFGERITFTLILGGFFIIAGVFYATSYDYVKKYFTPMLK